LAIFHAMIDAPMTSPSSAVGDGATDAAAADLDDAQRLAAEHTRQSLAHMARYGIRPEGRVALFLPPETRQADIHRMPYTHRARQRVVYTTEPGEFSALCPFSGLPDSGTVRIEYVPGAWLVELKSLKYYLLSWRHVGAAQEDVTALIYEDLLRHLGDPDRLVVTTDYTVRGGIHTVCTIDSREQAAATD
jgi:7-cyano-7-deazaguanine reductase